MGRADDAVALSLFKDVDRWTFEVDDADSITVHAAAACRNGEARKAILGVIDSFLKSARETMKDPEWLAAEGHEPVNRMAVKFVTNLRVEHTDRSVDLRADGIATLAEFVSFVKVAAVA